MFVSRCPSALRPYAFREVAMFPAARSKVQLPFNALSMRESSIMPTPRLSTRRFSSMGPSNAQAMNNELFTFKQRTLGVIMCAGLAVIGGVVFANIRESEKVAEQPKASPDFMKYINSEVLATILHSDTLPGVEDSDEEYEMRNEMHAMWLTLKERGFVEMTGTNKTLRPAFATLQGIVEHVLTRATFNQHVKNMEGLLVSNTPAAPLCTLPKESLDKPLVNYYTRQEELHERPRIIRDYLDRNAILSIYYTNEGYNKLSPTQQRIFDKEIHELSYRVSAHPLLCKEIPWNVQGALYLFTDEADHQYAFSIRIPEENVEPGYFGLWFGSVTDQPAVRYRINEVQDFVKNRRGI